MSISKLKAVDSSSTTSTTTSETYKVTALSGVIKGKFGDFMQFTVDGNTYNVDAKNVKGAQMFKPNCEAVITTNTYTNKEGVEVTYTSNLQIVIPQNCGWFMIS